MIDVENLVFDTVYNQLHSSYTNVNITSGYDEGFATFPTVVVREIDNQSFDLTATDPCAENHARLTYEVEVYSDKENTARSECKQLLSAVDEIMQGMKFRRIHKNRPLNIDKTIYRQYARYEAIVGKPVTYDKGTANERTVYQMYRR